MSIGTGESTKTEYNGIAAADKANDSVELYVWVQELLPFTKGELKAISVTTPIVTEGNHGGYSGNLNATNVIKAIYRGTNALSSLPPSVRKGESVKVWCYGDTDTWYWDTDGRNENLRRTDRKMFTVNSTDDYISEGGRENTYGIEINTRKDFGDLGITIYTSNKLGESFRYCLSINTTDGTILLGDDAGNDFSIDSQKKKITLKNGDNSMLQLDKENIILACQGDISIISKTKNIQLSANENIATRSGRDTSLTANASLSTSSAQDTTISAGAGVNITASASITNAAGANITDTAAGSWGISYSGGSCSGTGSNLTLSANQLDIRTP